MQQNITTSQTGQTDNDWERELANLLGDLTVVQTEMLDVLNAKRDRMMSGDVEGSKNLHERAEHLLQRLEGCHQRRSQLLQEASKRSLPSSSLGKLAMRAGVANRGGLVKQVKEASMRTRLLHHHSLASWVLAQRSLLHVAQMLEIIATGGRLQPTYGKGEPDMSGGALVDHEA